MLMAQHKMKLRYLRHPYLDAGTDLQDAARGGGISPSRGYQVAPVTMDAWDWMYGGRI